MNSIYSDGLGRQLYYASDGVDVNKVTWLLEEGAPVNWRNSGGWTPLHRACLNNNPGCVKVLLQHGADVMARNVYAKTPLHMACWSGSIDCVKLLMATGQCDLG